MKKISILLTMMLLLLTACDAQTPADVPSDTPTDTPTTGDTLSGTPLSETVSIGEDGYADYLEFPGFPFGDYGLMLNCFAVDENGILYLEGPHSTDEKKFYTTVVAYGLDGNASKEYLVPNEMGSNYLNMCVRDGMLFYTSWGDGIGHDDQKADTKTIYGYNLETGEQKCLEIPTKQFPLKDAVKKLAYLDGKLYILGVMEKYITDEYEDLEYLQEVEASGMSPMLNYDGRVLASYGIANETFEIVFDGPIRDFSITPDGMIMMQVYDPYHEHMENGNIISANSRYYFTELDPVTLSLGDRIYREISQPVAFATDGAGVLFPVRKNAGVTLSYWLLEEDKGIAEMYSVPYTGSGRYPDQIAYHGGFTYYLGTILGDAKLIRVRNSAYIDFGAAVNIIATYDIIDEGPQVNYNTIVTDIPDEEFALTVLSGGSSYDMIYMSSMRTFASNIRDKGSFYPLNDVPGVQEFLDACFPYVRDAATDEDGNIWMLPIALNVEGIIYKEDNCKKSGLDFANAATWEDVTRILEKTIEEYDPKDYRFITLTLRRNSIAQYLRNNNTLDTPEFRRMAEAMKKIESAGLQLGVNFPSVINTDMFAIELQPNPNFLFDGATGQLARQFDGIDGLSAVAYTGKGDAATAQCKFFCVNPESENLERSLNFISLMCEALMTDKQSLLLAESPIFTGSEYGKNLQAMYENAVIDFNISDEVFADVFDKYLNDEISLDEMIKEADRKLAMYRGE